MAQDLIRELDEYAPLTPGEDLTMAGVLSMPDHLRAFLTWMMRQKVVQVDTVRAYLDQDFDTAAAFLGQLVKKGLAEEATTPAGEKEFSVTVRSSRSFRVPDRIWKVFDE